MALKPEEKVKKLIKDWLKERNIPYWMVAPSPYGTSTGMSDFICILPQNGRFLAIEAKALNKKDKLTEKQADFLQAIRDSGGYGFVVDRQEDLDQIAADISFGES